MKPGLDGRHRDRNGEISRKHDNTKLGTLQNTYGEDFFPEYRSDMHLGTLLDREGAGSLSELLKRKH